MKSFAAVLLVCVATSLVGAQTTLNGAGSTFAYPIMSKWASEYHKINPNVQVNYQSIGSGGGIRQVSEGVVDFGATDGPTSDQDLGSSKVGKLLHVPVVMGADVPAYNIPGMTTELKFTPETIAGIFLGKITKWNDPEITKSNPGVKLPDLSIVVVHRSDGSGTTYIWTDYLSKISPEWNSKVGKGTSVKWPTGLGGKGNEGVAGQIRQMPGSIGYIELIYAEQNKIAFGSVRNSSGNFVKASMDGVTAAAATAQIPADFRYSITNAPGKNAYPISGTTWLLIPINSRDPNRGKQVVDFADWILGSGQAIAPSLQYAKLPDSLIIRVKQALKTVR